MKKWIVEARHSKTLTTYLGDVTFQKTLFRNRETKETSYLPDRILKPEPNQRLTEDAVAEMLKESVQTSYRRGGEQTSLAAQVSRQTVKNKIHALEFPPEDSAPKQKKEADYLYIDADEDHVALQFREKKGDLIKAENGGKNNGLAAKIVYVYEGKEKSPPKGGRRKLAGCHYFCGTGSGESNDEFRDGIYRYLERNYDLEKVKKIYLNADGGSRIKAGMKRIAGVTYVLDGFHLEKYLAKLTSHMKKEKKKEALEELREIIRKKTKKEFKEEVEKQRKEMPEWRNQKKVDEAAEYILSNWNAAKLRLKGTEDVPGSSTESHVSHGLSDRMSSRPKGWSRQGAEKMAKLRAYYLNGGDMLKLVRYQKKDKPEGEEEKEILSSAQIIHSEKNRHGEVGKYLESITHSVSDQVKKTAYFNAHIWGL